MSGFGVGSEKMLALLARWEELGIREEDVRESFIRSGGNGGQNVNKVATCVQLKHLPTGTEVKVQQERSQALNRYYARKLLADKIEDAVKGKESARRQEIEKVKRQKRRRSRKAQAKIRENKEHNSDKKASRKKPEL